MAEEASRLGRSKTKGIQASSFLLLEELVANFNNQIIIMSAQKYINNRNTIHTVSYFLKSYLIKFLKTLF
jgi:hypothetical protein